MYETIPPTLNFLSFFLSFFFSDSTHQRYLNFFSSLAFSATLLASWESAGGSLQAGLYNGGPAAIVYGIIISGLGNLAIATSLAELASVYEPPLAVLTRDFWYD